MIHAWRWLMLVAFCLAAQNVAAEGEDTKAEEEVVGILLVRCNKKAYAPHTIRRGESCRSIAGDTARFHFRTIPQVEQINHPISGFRCGAIKIGQIICHPKK